MSNRTYIASKLKDAIFGHKTNQEKIEIIIGKLNTYQKEINSPYNSLVQHVEQMTKHVNNIDRLQNFIDQIPTNSTNPKDISNRKDATQKMAKEKISLEKEAKKALKYKVEIYQKGDKMQYKYCDGITLIGYISNDVDAKEYLRLMQLPKISIEDYLSKTDVLSTNIESLTKLNLDEKACEALSILEKSFPNLDGYYIYCADTKWRFDYLDEEAILNLRKDNKLELIKTTKETHGVFETMAKWPQGWTDNPKQFFSNLTSAKYEANISRTDTRTEEIIDEKGRSTKLTLTQEECARVLLKFNEIILSVKIAGSITASFSFGQFEFAASLGYEVKAWAQASLKSLTASIGVSASAEAALSLNFESKELTLGDHKLTLELGGALKSYGKAQAVAAAGAMILAKDADDKVVGSYVNQDKNKLGQGAIDGTLGVAARAWAGIGVAVEVAGAVYCDINGFKTKLIGLAEEFHIEIGIGGQLALNLTHSTEVDNGNEYDVAELTLGLTVLAGAEFVTKVTIWKELYKQIFRSLKDYALQETKEYLKPHIKKSHSDARALIVELIGDAIKQAASKIAEKVERSWNSSAVKNLGLSLREKLGDYNAAIEGKIKRHHILIENENNDIKKRLEKIALLDEQLLANLGKYDLIKEDLRLTPNVTEATVMKNIASIQDIFGKEAVNEKTLKIAGKTPVEITKILNAIADNFYAKAVENYENMQKQDAKLSKTLANLSEQMNDFNDMLSQKYSKYALGIVKCLDDLMAVLPANNNTALSDKQKEVISKQNIEIEKHVKLLISLAHESSALLLECESNELLTSNFKNSIRKSNNDLVFNTNNLLFDLYNLKSSLHPAVNA